MKLVTLKIGVTNCYVIGDKHQVLIDAGEIGKFDQFTRCFKQNDINPQDIKLIVLTHTHWDHTGCLTEVAELTGAKVLVHSSEANRLKNGDAVMPPGITGWGRFVGKNLIGRMMPSQLQGYEPDIIMEGDEFPLADYGINGSLIHTPGHSPGSISLIYEGETIFVGDMAMSGFPLRLSPGMPILAEAPEKITKSWDTILDRGIKMIYVSHGGRIPVTKLKRDLPKS